MKIFIANDTKIGGPYSFSERLKTYINTKTNDKIVYSINQADVVLIIIKYNILKIIFAKISGKKIVHRIDGLYYKEKHGKFNKAYFTVNLKIFLIRKFFADLIIYQSLFSKKQCDILLGQVNKPYEIIYNGFASQKYSSHVDLVENQLNLVTTGNFRGEDMLPVILKAIAFLPMSFNVHLYIYGQNALKYINRYDSRRITFVDVIHNDKIGDTLQKYDAFIFSHLNPPCPNSVIEAISIGLPVVSFNSGSLPELLDFNIELLATIETNRFNKLSDFDPILLSEKVVYLIKNYRPLKIKSLTNKSKFNSSTTFHKYLLTMNSVL